MHSSFVTNKKEEKLSLAWMAWLAPSKHNLKKLCENKAVFILNFKYVKHFKKLQVTNEVLNSAFENDKWL